MSPAADKTTGEQPVSKESRNDSPNCTPRPKYGPSAPTISKAQLRRGLRRIYTQNKRSQTARSSVSMCADSCPCPWAWRPSPQPGWGWSWTGLGDGMYFSRNAEWRAMRRMCFVCRHALIVGDEHPTCLRRCPCPWASPSFATPPPNKNCIVKTVRWGGRRPVLERDHAEELERARRLSPIW
eukprot:TRINITY_DN2810_c0_g2_i13.p2 TRINITY_DN2810_c0_g2~~TRINITY_DN2810_c0_g2_i13.p2  ORF type:complete len:182 (-),score=3.06 TRINITY_DN2810_c0_g2_i13:1616-2161(-)